MATAVAADERLASIEGARVASTWRRFRKHRLGVGGAVVICLIILSAIIVPIISPFTISQANPLMVRTPILTPDTITGQMHWLGTDRIGKDVLTRVFYGGRVSLAISLVAALAVAVIGTFVGAIAGYFGGLVDGALMRITDFLLALPLLPMLIFTLLLFRSSPKLYDDVVGVGTTITIVFIIFGWMGIARLVRSSVLSLRQATFVEAATALGGSDLRIVFRHLIPNALAPVLVAGTFAVGDFIIWEAILAYFDQGINPDVGPSWGNLVADAQNSAFSFNSLDPFVDIRAYLLIVPGALIVLTVLSFNYVADALRDALDPHHYM